MQATVTLNQMCNGVWKRGKKKETVLVNEEATVCVGLDSSLDGQPAFVL